MLEEEANHDPRATEAPPQAEPVDAAREPAPRAEAARAGEAPEAQSRKPAAEPNIGREPEADQAALGEAQRVGDTDIANFIDHNTSLA